MFLLSKVIIVNLVIAFLFNLCVAEVNESFSLFTGLDNKKNIRGNNEKSKNDKNEGDNSDTISIDTPSVLDWEGKLKAKYIHQVNAKRNVFG